MKWTTLALVPVLLGCLLLPNAQAATIGTHAQVTNITVKQLVNKQRLKFTWDKVSTARRYRIKIFHGSTRIARKLVERRRAKFPETKFTDGETYTVYVRAKPNAKYAAAPWGTYTFTWSDEDHDNDFIPDTTDTDDDNDGIPDVSDPDPIGMSGTVYTVTIENNALVNGTVSITQDDSITWVNRDENGHAVAAEDGSWESPPLQHNESYTHAFTTAGVFPYYDPTYPNLAAMKATITVNSE